MADVVGREIVEIVPDFSKFASTVQASMKQIIAAWLARSPKTLNP